MLTVLKGLGKAYVKAKKIKSPIKKVDKLVKDLDYVDTKKYVDDEVKLGPIWKKTKTGAKVLGGGTAGMIAYGKAKQAFKKKRTKKAVGGILGKKAVKWLWKNRKKVRKDISSPENKKKIQDLTSKFKRGFRKN